MLVPPPPPLQAPPKTKRVQPAVPETDAPETCDPPDILAIIRDNLAFLDRIGQVLDAKMRAGHKS